MPQWNDDIYLGSAVTGLVNQGSVGNPGGRGVGPLRPPFVYDITPAASSLTNIAGIQAIVGAGNLVLQSTGTSGVTIGQNTTVGTILTFDVPRCVLINTSTNLSGITITVYGIDQYGAFMTETRTGPNATTLIGTKAFKSIYRISTSGSASNISVGGSAVFGLPYRVTDAGFILSVKWNNVLANDAGTFFAADTTSPATSSTNDVRGRYTPSVGAAPDGVRRLVIAIHLPAIASGPNATTTGALGVTQA